MASLMVYNSTTTTSLAVYGGLTTGEAILDFIPFLLRYVVNPIANLLALAASIINIIAFAKMDLSQGVNLNLLVLSLSDTVMGTLLTYITVLYALLRIGYTGKTKLMIERQLFYLNSIANYPLYISTMVTTLIAAVRCVSIVLPLSFRNILTAKRQLMIILTCCGIMSSCLSYLLYTSFIHYTTPPVNGSSLFRGATNLWRNFDIFRNVLLHGCLAASAVSMVFLIVALRKSSQFQRQASAVKSANTSQKSSTKSSGAREARVIKTVIVVLAIFVMCNLPLILLSILRAEVSGFSAVGKHRLWFNFIYGVAGFSAVLNIGLNSFAYYHFNSRYRQIVKAMFTGGKDEDLKA